MTLKDKAKIIMLPFFFILFMLAEGLVFTSVIFFIAWTMSVIEGIWMWICL